MENSRIELSGIVLPVPANQIERYICDFFLVHIDIEGKCGWIIGGVGKGYVGPPLKLLDGILCVLIRIASSRRF